MKRLALALALTVIAGGPALGGPALRSQPPRGEGGDNWPQWRGPSLNGTSDSTGLPLKWSDTENVTWKIELPSRSGSTPIIWGDRVFVTSPSALAEGEAPVAKGWPSKPKKGEGKDLLLLCLSKKDGSELWRKKIDGANYQIGKHNMSSPSPVTDGKMLWWLTGTGLVTAFTMEGKEVWTADLQKTYVKLGLNWGYGASPLLYEGLLIVPMLHGWDNAGPSYVIALDAATGKEVWKEERKTDAQKEGPDAYTTPMVMKYADRTEIIIVGGDYFTGHDPKTGKEIWRCGGLNLKQDKFYRAVCSPAIVGELVFACIKQGPFVGVKGGGKGLVTDTHIAWTNKLGCDVPTPVSDGKLLYVLNDGGFLSAYDPATGKAIYERQRLPGGGPYNSSPLLADGRIYCTNEKGHTTVVAAGPEYKVLAENPLNDAYTMSSVAVSGSRLFIRTSTHLYCIGK